MQYFVLTSSSTEAGKTTAKLMLVVTKILAKLEISNGAVGRVNLLLPSWSLARIYSKPFIPD